MTSSRIHKSSLILRSIALTVMMGISIPTSFAAIQDIYSQDEQPSKVGGIAGIALVSTAQAPGGNNKPVMPLPLLEYHWDNGWFAGTREGLGYSFSLRPDLQYGVFLNIDLGRPSSPGMDGVRPKPVLGTFADFALSREFMLTSSLRYGSGNNSNGAELNLGANYDFLIAPQWHLGSGVGLSLANTDYMQSYFGVNSSQSQNSGYSRYSPSAGLKDIRANLMLRYDVNKTVSITSGLTASSLTGSARNSPIVNKPNNVSGLLSISYGF